MKHASLNGFYFLYPENDVEKKMIEALWTPAPPAPGPTPPPSPVPEPDLPAGGLAVPTFHCVGLYWDPPTPVNPIVRYRKVIDATWLDAYPMTYDPRDHGLGLAKARGSIVNLQPGTDYVAQFGTPDGKWINQVSFRTWNEKFLEAVPAVVASRNTELDITTGGSEIRFAVVDGRGSTIDVKKNAPFCIRVSASYVIIRNFVLKGAKWDGIHIDPGVHDVVIEDNDISDWGFGSGFVPGSGPLAGKEVGANTDGMAGVCLWGRQNPTGGDYDDRSRQTKRIIIQRNKIHDPSYPALLWDYSHPYGCMAIFIQETGGNHVIRYNDIYWTDGDNDPAKRFYDGISGDRDFSKWGAPGSDSDVYGNSVKHTADDGMQIEGGNANTRIWGNFLDCVAVPVASTSCQIGPLYIWRNISNRCRTRYGRTLDEDDRLEFSKSYSDKDWGGGRRFLFHNTTLQPTVAGPQYGLGVGGGINGGGGNNWLSNTVSRNNIWHIHKDWWASVQVGENGKDNDIDYDLYNGKIPPGVERNGWKGVPKYKTTSDGIYQLDALSPGKGQAQMIVNFGGGLDPGARQEGEPPPKFGIP